MDEVIYIEPYFPKSVQYIITTGSCHYIGVVDKTTVLKYPHVKGPSPALDVEYAMFRQLGEEGKDHHIIEFKGKHQDGLLLEYALCGSLETYIRETDITREEKIRFAKETAEGVAYAHGKNIIICDINVRNVLLDTERHVKLCDFQGRLLGSDGKVIYDGGASENAESFMPRDDKDSADVKSDIFALGSTIYYIATGHRPFPELDTIDDEAEFLRRFREGQFPRLEAEVGGEIVRKCWECRYSSASEVVADLGALQAALGMVGKK
ncbi:kinase-like domain-containing protein [Ampelomyces quisqualis]|uniref:Kinase-like domain-containing protein n=1 Tax=Ampelomyces quisqualis TaxID=50730 RepID=A0A6A5QWY0_AMPQU|nr:kinase-like domain-containing protein [Ampelomyces quisqualis]